MCEHVRDLLVKQSGAPSLEEWKSSAWDALVIVDAQRDHEPADRNNNIRQAKRVIQGLGAVNVTPVWIHHRGLTANMK